MKTIFIDWGGTLVHLNPIIFEKILKIKINSNSFRIAQDIAKIKIDLKTPPPPFSSLEYFLYLTFKEIPGIDDKTAKDSAIQTAKLPYSEFWNKLDDSAVNLLKELHNKYSLVILSNDTGGIVDEIKQYGLGSYFDDILYSELLGYKKPEKEIFYEACKRRNISPKDSCYIADVPKNDIYAAISCGMKGILINSAFDKTVSHNFLVFDNLKQLLECQKQKDILI